MVTKYDVFAAVIKKAPCKIKDLEFKKPVYFHVKNLLEMKWLKRNKSNNIIPIKNKKTEKVFKIISWCVKNNINYNLLFLNTIKDILTAYSKKIPYLRPKNLSNDDNVLKLLKYLEDNQFILVRKKRPRLGTILNHRVFDNIIKLKDLSITIKEKFAGFKEIKNILAKAEEEINPFDEKIFEFISGSAQLEGSTISAEETVDLITKDIYPDKPAKDIQVVKNLNQAMNYVLENIDQEITIQKIKDINRLCLFSLHAGSGTFKKAPNKIHGNPRFKTTSPYLVPIEVKKFCHDFNFIKTREECLTRIGFIHNRLQRIHPFPDGNSRTTRLIVNWLLLKFKLPILVLKAGSFDKYMSITKLAEKRYDNKLRDFLLHVIVHEHIVKN